MTGTGYTSSYFLIHPYTDRSNIAPIARTPSSTVVAPPSLALASIVRQSEELFRDRIDGDHENTQRGDSVKRQAHRMRPQKSPLNRAQPPVRMAGRTIVNPKLPSQSQDPTQMRTPTLSAPPPRQNVVELLTARPETVIYQQDKGGPDTIDDDPWTTTGMGQGPEVDEERERRLTHRTVTSQGKRIVVPASPGLRLKKNSPDMVQQETLSFLERLDLKALLSSPRPDVLSFYPPMQTTTAVLDERVEGHSLEPQPPLLGLAKHVKAAPFQPAAVVPIASTATKNSSRKETAADIASRLAHMELTYGTTIHETRKARPETFARLSNPISGHSSTLEALSPQQRKKRQEASSLLPMTSNKQSHEQATKPLIKGSHVALGRSTNNQEDEREEEAMGRRKKSSRTSSSGNSRRLPSKRLEERKAALKQKLQAKRPDDPAQYQSEHVQSGNGIATFLTQNEDSEAKISSQLRGRLPRLDIHPLTEKPIAPVPQRPVPQPKSVRATAPIKGPLEIRLKKSLTRGRTLRATSSSNAAADPNVVTSRPQRGRPSSSGLMASRRERPTSSTSAASTSRRVQASSWAKASRTSTAIPSATCMMLMGTADVDATKAHTPDKAGGRMRSAPASYSTNKKVIDN